MQDAYDSSECWSDAGVASDVGTCAEGTGSLAFDDRYVLSSLGDLVELLVEGWTIERLHYADSSGPGGTGAPAAYVALRRGPGRRTLFVLEDERTYSHRALVGLFREHPHIWKHRSPGAIASGAGEPLVPLEEWGEVPQPFPGALALTPSTLRGVVAVNQTQTVDGLDIALTALERHEAGARLRYLAHARDADSRRRMRVLDVLAVDDHGRRYEVAPLDSGGEGNHLEGALAIAPAIPEAVSALTVAIGTVASAEARSSGPWLFPIPLGLA